MDRHAQAVQHINSFGTNRIFFATSQLQKTAWMEYLIA